MNPTVCLATRPPEAASKPHYPTPRCFERRLRLSKKVKRGHLNWETVDGPSLFSPLGIPDDGSAEGVALKGSSAFFICICYGHISCLHKHVTGSHQSTEEWHPVSPRIRSASPMAFRPFEAPQLRPWHHQSPWSHHPRKLHDNPSEHSQPQNRDL